MAILCQSGIKVNICLFFAEKLNNSMTKESLAALLAIQSYHQVRSAVLVSFPAWAARLRVSAAPLRAG